MITHFDHPVLEVLEGVSVSGTAAAHNLLIGKECKADLLTTERRRLGILTCDPKGEPDATQRVNKL